MKIPSQNNCPMSSGPEIKNSLFRGICELPKTQRLPCYNPHVEGWREEGKGRYSSIGAPQTQSQLKQHDFHPSASVLLSFSFLLSPPRFPCARTIAQRGTSLQKQHKGEERRFLQSLILGSWKKGSAEVSLSLSLFVPVQKPCFLMKMSRWMRALDARSNPV